jgi:hypothetical protein
VGFWIIGELQGESGGAKRRQAERGRCTRALTRASKKKMPQISVPRYESHIVLSILSSWVERTQSSVSTQSVAGCESLFWLACARALSFARSLLVCVSQRTESNLSLPTIRPAVPNTT